MKQPNANAAIEARSTRSTDPHTQDNAYNLRDGTQQVADFPGLGDDARQRLATLTGATPAASWLWSDEKTPWETLTEIDTIARRKRPPMFTTTTWRAPDPDNPTLMLHLADGLWIDLDAQDITDAVKALKTTANKMQALKIPLQCCSLFASGGKGFHIFIPLALIQPRGAQGVDIATVRIFPRLCKDFVFDGLITDSTDMSLYCERTGHLIRNANVQRNNGAYKVPCTWQEALTLTAESYRVLCSKARPAPEIEPVQEISLPAAMLWDKLKSRVKPPRPAPKTNPKQQEADRPKILKLLRAIDPASLDYRDWLRVGAALKTWGAHDALALWGIFSSLDKKRFRPGVCESKWDGLTPGTVGIGTLVMLAKNGGTK